MVANQLSLLDIRCCPDLQALKGSRRSRLQVRASLDMTLKPSVKLRRGDRESVKQMMGL